MITRTLYFGNPVYLSLRQKQLVVRLPGVDKSQSLPDSFKRESETTIPIEDIGVVVLDHPQITITHALIEQLLDNNCALITCSNTHHPVGLLLPLCGNNVQTERFRDQIDASLPLKKQLWQQTISAKIINQAHLLHTKEKTIVNNMIKWANDVKSGDPDNLEARAAVYYWANIFPRIKGFTRAREGAPPNHLLNYGYAILRAIVARALVSSGLLPTLGIFHCNKYNAYCLADDIMEPYRPFVDQIVADMPLYEQQSLVLNKEMKIKLLSIPTANVVIDGKVTPLMVAVGLTSSSLYKCFSGELRKILYPKFEK